MKVVYPVFRQPYGRIRIFGGCTRCLAYVDNTQKFWAGSGKPFPKSGFFRKNPDQNPDFGNFFLTPYFWGTCWESPKNFSSIRWAVLEQWIKRFCYVNHIASWLRCVRRPVCQPLGPPWSDWARIFWHGSIGGRPTDLPNLTIVIKHTSDTLKR